MGSTKRNREVDLLRGIAAIAVILGHTIIVYPVNVAAVPWCSAVHYAVCSFHMPLFFILAGFCYKCTDYVTYIKGKAKRILVPYLFFGTITTLLHRYGGAFVNGAAVSLAEGFKDRLLYASEIWFLYTLFMIFLIYPLIDKIFGKIWLKAALIVILPVIMDFVEIPRIFALNRVLHYLPFFIAGHCIRQHPLGFGDFSKAKKIISAVGCAAVFALTVYIDKAVKPDLMTVLLFQASSASALLYMLVRCVKINNKFGETAEKWLCKSSENSLQFYLFQGYFLTLFRYIICRVLKIENPAVIVISLFVLMLSCCIIGTYVVKRIPVLSFLCGYKNTVRISKKEKAGDTK